MLVRVEDTFVFVVLGAVTYSVSWLEAVKDDYEDYIFSNGLSFKR